MTTHVNQSTIPHTSPTMRTINSELPSEPSQWGVVILTLVQLLLLGKASIETGLLSTSHFLYTARETLMLIAMGDGIELVLTMSLWVLMVAGLIIAPITLIRNHFSQLTQNPNDLVLDSWLIEVLINVGFATSVIGIYTVFMAAPGAALFETTTAGIIYAAIGLLAFATYVDKKRLSNKLAVSSLYLFYGLSAAHVYLLTRLA